MCALARQKWDEFGEQPKMIYNELYHVWSLIHTSYHVATQT